MRKRYASTIGKGIVSALLLVVALFPIFWLLGVSLRPTAELKGHITLLPRSLTMAHFSSLFAQKGFGTAIKNSVETTISATLLSLAIGLSSAYVLSRKRFRFGLKRPVSFWVMLVRILPPVAFTIPLYTMFAHSGMLNTKVPVVLACVLINITLIIWYMMGFFQDIPEEIEESARIDGASEFATVLRIVLPLAAPGLSAIAMLSFLYAWNEYAYSVVFVQSPKNYTVPLALVVLNTEDNVTNFGLVSAAGVISVIPITLFVIFAQNYLLDGLSQGAVKS
jgi:ABC-type glycerol-3-phosphate transport system permease component